MSTKLTKKNLKDMGISFNAYYLGGNVYSYENVIHYLEARSFDDMLEHGTQKAKDIKDYILNRYKNLDNIRISATQIAYSVGIYGNNGQLHKISICDENWEVLESIFTYYC